MSAFVPADLIPFHIWWLDDDPDDPSKVYYTVDDRPLCEFDVPNHPDASPVAPDGRVRLVPPKHAYEFDSLGELLTHVDRCDCCARRLAERVGLLDWTIDEVEPHEQPCYRCESSRVIFRRSKAYVATVDHEDQTPLGFRAMIRCESCGHVVNSIDSGEPSRAGWVSDATERDDE